MLTYPFNTCHSERSEESPPHPPLPEVGMLRLRWNLAPLDSNCAQHDKEGVRTWRTK